MNRLFIILLILIFPGMMKAQLNDSFTDGNFTSNPEWIGDLQQFKINSSLQLQLNSTGTGSSGLVTQISLSDSMEWDFWVKLSFSPSDNNLARIYLFSDLPDLKSPLNGYFIKLGESGSNDAIELVRQSGSTETSLCRGTEGLLASSFNIRIRVTHTGNSGWNVFADPHGGTDYHLECTATDQTFVAGGWFGVSCKYTSSNSTKFYFDDFYAGSLIVDKTPPELLSASFMNNTQIKLRFSEIPDSATACNVSNYIVDQGVGNPVYISRDNTDHSFISLSFLQEFQPDVPYILSVSNVSDLAGNRMTDRQDTIKFHVVRAFDILINEIMADPNPPPSLPGMEYLELYNKVGSDIEITGWSLYVGSVKKPIPPFIMKANSYVLLCDEDSRPYYEPLGPVIPFSSFSLSNTGTTVTLRNADGAVIHSVSYSEDWYHSDYKKEGGWSLEMIDPLNPCGDAGNWTASNDAGGGTPGRVNSVYSDNPDHLAPRVARIGIIDPFHLDVFFSERMDSAAIANPLNYSVDKGIGIPLSATSVTPAYREVNLELQQAVVEGEIYNLSISGIVIDCAGNQVVQAIVTRFARPEKTTGNDIVINEILFDPKDGCVDFVEVYNRSSKVLDLKDLTLCAYDTLGKSLSEVCNISDNSFVVLPGEYFVLTSDTSALRQCHQINAEPLRAEAMIQMSKLPGMKNDKGSIALALKTGEIIDQVCYSADMQYPLLISLEGVSLERIHPDCSSMDRTNWHSAAENVGFATPAEKNSQFGNFTVDGNEIQVGPEIFSPDNDGNEDVLNISYSFSTPGYNARVTIYDASGHLIRNLITNELCGTSGSWSWDGINNRREKAPIGRYIILVEVFDLQGNVKKYKRTAVLGGIL
ncbi:MAG: lamin tail domain-containing protein [Bacteroidetes bacterium]|nr:lamin tail domain-containing protein [Bacteroidota bacterium]